MAHAYLNLSNWEYNNYNNYNIYCNIKIHIYNNYKKNIHILYDTQLINKEK